MTQFQLSPGASSTQTLTVTNYPSIGSINITGPSSPQVYQAALTCGFTYLNNGGDGTTIFTLKDQLGATLGSINVATPPGVGSGTINFTMPAQDTFWGARYGRVRDPFGHIWAFHAPHKKKDSDEH